MDLVALRVGAPLGRAASRSLIVTLLTHALAGPAVAGGACENSGHCVMPRWTPALAAPFEQAGRTVEIDGGIAAVGAPGGDAVYVYERTDDHWQEVQRLGDPAGAGNDFGFSLDIDSERILVGSPAFSVGADHAGAAYLYERIGGNWTLTETFVEDTPIDFAHVGHDVGLSGSHMVLGSPGGASSGRLLTYRELLGGWTLLFPLSTSNAELGSAIDIDEGGDGAYLSIVAGDWSDDPNGPDSGIVHQFELVNGVVQTHSEIYGPTAGDYFGYAVDYDGERLIVGAYGDDDMGNNAGAAYVYSSGSPGPPFALVEKIFACEPAALDNFGRSVKIENGRAIVGAPNHESAQDPGGKAFVFRRQVIGSESWNIEDVAVAPDGQLDDDFGWDVALSEGQVLVGARRADAAGDMSGAAYFVSLTSALLDGGECPCDTLASQQHFGAGKPGALGDPQLAANRPPVPGESSLMVVSNVMPGSTPFLIWGFDQGAIPFDDGMLYVADPNVVAFPVAAIGQAGINWDVPPNPAVCGVEIFAQAMVFDIDALGPFGTAQSRGLRLVIGY